MTTEFEGMLSQQLHNSKKNKKRIEIEKRTRHAEQEDIRKFLI